MKILNVITNSRKYGGKIYEDYFKNALQERYQCDDYRLRIFHYPFLSTIVFIFRVIRLFFIRGYDIYIWEQDPFYFVNPAAKHIVIFHHYDPSVIKLFYTSWFRKLIHYILLRSKHKIDAVVVPSRYWANYLTNKGFKNVAHIYNPFEIEKYRTNELAIANFRKKYNLKENRKIIYIGNANRAKGIYQVSQQLQDLDVYCVCSGVNDLDGVNDNRDNIIYLGYLPFKEYIALLHASSLVITMSLFKEGWCRVAHEAILCKTTVIGSGMGAMQELLEASGQYICSDINKLKQMVKTFLDDDIQVSEKSYKYASQFSLESFNNSVHELIAKIKV